MILIIDDFNHSIHRPIYVNVDSPNLGFPYFNFLGGYQLKKHPVYIPDIVYIYIKKIRKNKKNMI